MPLQIADRSAVPVFGLLMATLAVIGLYYGGFLTITPGLIAIVSGAILIFGLPHGAFDLALLRRGEVSEANLRSTIVLVALYLLVAGGTYLAWRAGPGLALAAFLVLAVAHFAEDWRACGSRFVAVGIAVAIVSAPSLLHGDSLGNLFGLLTNDPRTAVLADLLLLVAPVAVAVAIVGTVLLWQARQPAMAIALGCATAAMILLPPVIGFALFFCLVHSPAQFRHHAESLGLHGFRQWGSEVVPFWIGGLGIAVAVFLTNREMPVAANVFASSFMTLAVLTVPHMVMPMIAVRLRHLRPLAA